MGFHKSPQVGAWIVVRVGCVVVVRVSICVHVPKIGSRVSRTEPTVHSYTGRPRIFIDFLISTSSLFSI